MSEGKKQGITAKKSENLDEWYTQVILKSELADYSPVSGCMVFRPTAYAIWEKIQHATDAEFKRIGIQNVYFPIFIPERLLQKEAEHVKVFSPEVAWVTHAGDSKLEERLAVRPTSETIMYDVISKWIRSWRDLPLRLNQWNNVVRWEFKHPTPFLRSREFLWNEGHTAFATKEEAMAERDEILGIYKKITEEYLALPGLMGRKSDREKFAGALESYSIEHLLPDGKAIQGPDFHFDGENFAKVFGISFIDKMGEKQFAWQNTWAISTREIGVMTAIHSDDRGLVIPPRLAPVQVVIVPIFDDENRDEVLGAAREIRDKLKVEVSVSLDDRDYLTAGRKYNEWELKGIPLRIEIGPREIRDKKVVLARRDLLEKRSVKLVEVQGEVSKELESIQKNLLEKATSLLQANLHRVDSYDQFKETLANKGGILQAPWCSSQDCEDKIREETGAKIINIPLEQKFEKAVCIKCGKPAKVIANFSKSY
jgi:prolyl-tRNA synthetase